MLSMTEVASRSWGMARGLTNDVASMMGRPASASMWIKCILCSVGIQAFSLCRPSRGPTSTIFTCGGMLDKVAFFEVMVLLFLLLSGKSVVSARILVLDMV